MDNGGGVHNVAGCALADPSMVGDGCSGAWPDAEEIEGKTCVPFLLLPCDGFGCSVEDLECLRWKWFFSGRLSPSSMITSSSSEDL